MLAHWQQANPSSFATDSTWVSNLLSFTVSTLHLWKRERELEINLTRERWNINANYCHNPSLTKGTDLWLSTGLAARYFWILLQAQTDSHWHLICLTLTFPTSTMRASCYCCNSPATRQEFKLWGWIQGHKEGWAGLTHTEKSPSGSWALNQGPKPKIVPKAKEKPLNSGAKDQTLDT